MSNHTPKQIAEAVLRLSDYFIQHPDGHTPWEETWAQVAYQNYFFPLNYARNARVVEHGIKENFFNGLDEVLDFGSGLGAASKALSEKVPALKNFTHIERSAIAIKLHKEWLENKGNHSWLYDVEENPGKTTLTVFSYSLTEIEKLPDWAFESEALMILEPSTQEDGRRLLELRQFLLDNGYHMWAPCTHQQACPLLVNSKTDWCHDRVHYKASEEFLKVENFLPMKNKTLTMSYLLARKTPPVRSHGGEARLVGDFLEEKGKSRQLVCRSSTREYLAWMDRDKIPQHPLPRGELILWPSKFEEKSNEIRVKELPVCLTDSRSNPTSSN